MVVSDVLIVGGGVIGLSLAYELSRHGQRVRILDQAQIGREASWAGAGILPPANFETSIHPYDQLRGRSYELHLQWHHQLQAETGIDNGLRICGGLYFARTLGEAAALHAFASELSALQITCKRIDAHSLATIEPALAPLARSHKFHVGYQLPGEGQLRNPRHLKALLAACQLRGVEVVPQCEVTGCEVDNEALTRVFSPDKIFQAAQVCFTAGAWTYRLLQQLNIPSGIMPIRGQMVLYKCETRPFRHILNEGPRYLVPRDDGHVLAGSTEEEVGFDKRTTPEALNELEEFAESLVPCLTADKVQQTWAGLRPGTFDGLPYIGQIPRIKNAFVAAGHFRSGLYLSPGTAVVLSQLMQGAEPEIDLGPFSIGRG